MNDGFLTIPLSSLLDRSTCKFHSDAYQATHWDAAAQRGTDRS